MTSGNAVEDEIVAMKFENTQFESAAGTTLGTLEKLKNTLSNFGTGLGKGIGDISGSIRGFNMNPMVDSASEVSKAFSSMSVVAISAIATVASEATNAGLGIVKSLSISPITQGFAEYDTTIGSIQTILSNTGLEGQKGLDKVNQSLDELNTYSDKTIYNFTEMAKNIGTFTAAGVDLDKSTAAIKGIANLAAVSGSTSQQASTAMYQLSQALASGTVKLMDWNSVVNAGMGGKVFKDAIMETARAHGIAIDDMIKKDGSFRDTLQEGWFTSDILTQTLQKFTGDLSKSQLKAMGYTDQQIKSIIKLGKMANDAATKVKTLPQLMDTLKEAVGSGWTESFRTIFGDFLQARVTFTSLSNYFGDIIKSSADSRNKMLADWAALNGRTKLINAIKNAWKALLDILGPIHDAFREIFPATTGEQLKNFTKSLNQFFRGLRLSKDAQENLKNAFAGLFAVIHIGITIISGILHVLGTLLGLFVHGQGTTLAFAGGIGKALVALDAFLTKGQYVSKFFDALAKALTGIFGPLLAIRSALIGAFAALVTGDKTSFFDGIAKAIQIALDMVDKLSAKFADLVNTVSDSLGGLGHIHGFDLSSLFGGAGGGANKAAAAGAAGGIAALKKGLSGLDALGQKVRDAWDHVLHVFHEIGDFFRPLVDQFKTVVGAIHDALGNIGKGVSFDGVLKAIQTGLFLAIFLQIERFTNDLRSVAHQASNVLSQVTSNLKSMQAEVRASVLLQIAVSLALLAAAIFLLSKTDPAHLAVSLGAVSIMLIELVTALKILEKKIGKGAGVKLIEVSIALGLMAVAVAAMAAAVYLFGLMDLKSMQKGMLGVSEAIALLVASAVLISKGGGGANMIGAAIGLTIMSAALVALAGAVKLYSRIDPKTLKSGLIKIGVALLVLAGAMQLMRGTLGGAAAMAIVSGSLILLAGAFKLFAAMSWGEIIKAVITMSVALDILTGAMAAATSGLPGAGALLVMAAALTILGPAIAALGQLSWGTIVKGLVVIIGALVSLGIIAGLMAPVVPVLLALAAAFALIGAGVFLAGTGVAALAGGLALLAHNGSAGFTVFMNILNDFLNNLPILIEKFGGSLDAMAKLLSDHAGPMTTAFYELIGKMLDGATKLMPKFGRFLSQMIVTGLKVLVSFDSALANAGLQLIVKLLEGIRDHIDPIVTIATDIVITFIKSLGKNTVRLANAGLQVLVDFLNGLADAINSHAHEINAAGLRVAGAIVNGIKDGIWQAQSDIIRVLTGMMSAALHSAENALKGAASSLLHHIVPRESGVTLTGNFLKLIGDKAQVKQALADIKQEIDDTLSKSKADIQSWQKKLAAAKKAGDPKAVAAAQKALNAAHATQKDAIAAEKAYQKEVKSHKAALEDLAKTYGSIQKAIDNAQAALADAQQKQADFKKSVMDTFGSIPAPQAGESLTAYMRQLKAQQDKIEKFKETLAALRAAGLDDESYKRFISEGLDAQSVMTQLLAGGPGAIQQFEAANQGLEAAAQSLADLASSQLGFDQAVSDAQKFVDGLVHGLGDQKGLDQIKAAMGKIAKIMMKAIRDELEVKSPSRKAAEVGRFFVLGLINQMNDMHSDVDRATAALGAQALSTLQTTMSQIGDGVNGALDMSPVITPILDLTKLTKDANAISSLIADNPIAPSVSFGYASDISANRQSSGSGTDAPPPGSGDTYLDVTQNLYSPKAIGPVETYRTTKNLMSLLKDKLGV